MFCPHDQEELMRFSTAIKVTAAVVAAGMLGVVLLVAAGPAASTGARYGAAASGVVQLRAVPVATAIAAAAVVPGNDPRIEAMSIDRLSRAARHQAWLDRLHAWKAEQARQAKEARERRQRSSAAAFRVPSVGGSVRSMVIALFSRIAGSGQVPMALCIANRESSFNPYARNPHSSASGVFQWVSRSWSGYSRRYGFAGASVFNAYANISVAAHAVADGGWGPWGGSC
jgi:hypothetical protein